jgi:hypothetical protein
MYTSQCAHSNAIGHGTVNGKKLAEKGLQPVQGHHVWSIAKGILGIGVHLQEQTVHTNSHRRPSQGRHEFPLAAGAAAPPAGLMHGVGGIKDHRAAKCL